MNNNLKSGLTTMFEYGVRLFKLFNIITGETAVYYEAQKQSRTADRFRSDVLQGMNAGGTRSYHNYFRKYGSENIFISEPIMIYENISKRQAEILKRGAITVHGMTSTDIILNSNSGRLAGTGRRFVA